MGQNDKGSAKRISVTYVSPKDLKPWAENPRYNARAVGALTAILKEHGFIDPIIASPDGTVRAGHSRLEAAIRLGLEKVPVIFVQFDSEDDAELFSIADNRSTEWAEWDEELLFKLLQEKQTLTSEELARKTAIPRGRIGLMRKEYKVEGSDISDRWRLYTSKCPKCGAECSTLLPDNKWGG